MLYQSVLPVLPTIADPNVFIFYVNQDRNQSPPRISIHLYDGIVGICIPHNWGFQDSQDLRTTEYLQTYIKEGNTHFRPGGVNRLN